MVRRVKCRIPTRAAAFINEESSNGMRPDFESGAAKAQLWVRIPPPHRISGYSERANTKNWQYTDIDIVMCVIDNLSKEQIIELSKEFSSASAVFRHLSIKSCYSTVYYRKWNARCKELGIDPETLFIGKDRSIRETISDVTLISTCQKQTSAVNVFKVIGLSLSGSNFRWIKEKIKQLNINTKHWAEAKKKQTQKAIKFNTIPIEEILVENSDYLSNSSLKKRLLKENLLNYKCYECGISTWRGKELSLHLEHKNGTPNDNRIENLELLCPNCHSQTKTFAGRNARKGEPQATCPKCNKNICSTSMFCNSCSPRETKINWPDNNELLKMVQETNYTQTAKKLGVSDNAIRKRLKRAGLI